MSTSSERVVHYAAADASVVTVGPFILFRCFSDVSADAVNASLPAHKAALASRPEGVVSIVLIDPSTKFPSEDMRRASVLVRKRTNRNVAGNVTIVAGEGFWASTVRGALTAIDFLATSPYESRVFRDPAEGVAWGVARTGGASSARVKQLLEELDAMARRP